MRIKVLSRDEKQYTRERPNDLQRVQRNAAPELHPFERAREYKRALNAVKLDRVFAKPFLGIPFSYDNIISFLLSARGPCEEGNSLRFPFPSTKFRVLLPLTSPPGPLVIIRDSLPFLCS